MVDFVSPVHSPPIVSSASDSGAVIAAVAAAADDDDLHDACSICLEPFNSEDPSTVTNCKHEYHLQCILEWSQRSKECPICWQLLVLKDPASQELLAAVENERNLRSRRTARCVHDDNEINHDNSYTDASDFDEHIMRQFAAAAARRARYGNRRGRQRSSVPTGDLPDGQAMHTSPEESQSTRYELLDGGSPNSSMLSATNAPTATSGARDGRDGFIKLSQLSSGSPERSSSSEFRVFTESIKSKFSDASARYKDSISKSTQGFKEKLLSRNISVKDLGKGVQREMNAGITSMARIFERLDLTSKRTGVSVPLSSSPRGTSKFSFKQKDMQENVSTQSPTVNAEETANDVSSAASPCV